MCRVSAEHYIFLTAYIMSLMQTDGKENCAAIKYKYDHVQKSKALLGPGRICVQYLYKM